MKTIPLAQIRIDGGTQVRKSIDPEMVTAYCEAMAEGAKFPPIVVFHDGTDYWCADGFHRILAAKRCGFDSFACDVRSGTADDAAWFALGANRAHGKRLNRADVRNAIALALRKFAGKSNRKSPRRSGVLTSRWKTRGRRRSQLDKLTSWIAAPARTANPAAPNERPPPLWKRIKPQTHNRRRRAVRTLGPRKPERTARRCNTSVMPSPRCGRSRRTIRRELTLSPTSESG